MRGRSVCLWARSIQGRRARPTSTRTIEMRTAAAWSGIRSCASQRYCARTLCLPCRSAAHRSARRGRVNACRMHGRPKVAPGPLVRNFGSGQPLWRTVSPPREAPRCSNQFSSDDDLNFFAHLAQEEMKLMGELTAALQANDTPRVLSIARELCGLSGPGDLKEVTKQ